MASWYLSKIRFQKEDEAGKLQTIDEAYLIDAVSFTEAEKRSYKLITTGASDFSVNSISRMRLADLFSYEEGEQWFKAKVIYFTVDERSGKEKKIVNLMLVNAEGIQQAMDRINESMRNFLIPYEITDLNLTSILDVFPYTAEEDQEPEIPANLRPLSEVMAERQQQEQPTFEVRSVEGGYQVFDIKSGKSITKVCEEDVAKEICSDFNAMQNGDFSPLLKYEEEDTD